MTSERLHASYSLEVVFSLQVYSLRDIVVKILKPTRPHLEEIGLILIIGFGISLDVVILVLVSEVGLHRRAPQSMS